MYGTVRTVVWEEGRRKAPSYPIQSAVIFCYSHANRGCQTHKNGCKSSKKRILELKINA